jgi:hypothetical protein
MEKSTQLPPKGTYPQLLFENPGDVGTVKERRRGKRLKHSWNEVEPGVFQCDGCGRRTSIEEAAEVRDTHCAPLKPRAAMTRDDVLARWPSLVAHLICASLGYATPSTAAQIILDYANGRENWCEWIYSCHGRDPAPAVRLAWKCRHHHKGYMADYKQALGIVVTQIATDREPLFASWF